MQAIQEYASFIRELSIEFINEAQNQIEWFNKEVETFAEKNLPNHIKHVALAIFRSIPETLVCASVFTGYGVMPATIFWAARVVMTFSPLIKTLLSSNCTRETLSNSAAESIENLLQSYKRFIPAICAAAAVGAAAYAVLGWVSASYALMVQSTIYGIVAGVTAQAINREAEAEIRI